MLLYDLLGSGNWKDNLCQNNANESGISFRMVFVPSLEKVEDLADVPAELQENGNIRLLIRYIACPG